MLEISGQSIFQAEHGASESIELVWDFGKEVLDVLGTSRPCATTSAGWVSLKRL